MPILRELLADGRVHVIDGAMGTMLYDKGIFLNACFDELVVKAPDVVSAVHAAYADAGAEIIETNTFGANPIKLVQYGLSLNEVVAAAQKATGVLGAGFIENGNQRLIFKSSEVCGVRNTT